MLIIDADVEIPTSFTLLNVPAPDVLEEALGYGPSRLNPHGGTARYFAFAYERWSDGQGSAGGAAAPFFPFKLYTSHPAVMLALGHAGGINLGSDDGPPDFMLVLDRRYRHVWLAPADHVEPFLRRQWAGRDPDVDLPEFTEQDLGEFLAELQRVAFAKPTPEQITAAMRRRGELNAALSVALDASDQARDARLKIDQLKREWLARH